MKRIYQAAAIAALILGSAFVSASAQTLDFHAILQKIDALSDFQHQDLSLTATVVSDEPGKDRSIQKIRLFRRDKDDKFLVLIDQPDVQKGQGYLKADDNLWFYDPNTRNFSHTSLKERFGDSQANNSDFKASSLATDYKVVNSTQAKLGKFDVYILDLQALNDTVTYPSMKLWVTTDLFLVLKEENYSLSKRLMRTSYFTNYQKVNEHYIPLVQLFVNNLTEGEKTQMTMSDVSLGAIPDKVFTKTYVEQVSR